MREIVGSNLGKYQNVSLNALDFFSLSWTSLKENIVKESEIINQLNRQQVLSKRGGQWSYLLCMRRGLSPAVGR